VSQEGSGPGPRAFAYVDWTLRWGSWLWAFALAIAIPAGWRTANLYAHLRSELEQLLPRSAPSVVALDELRARMPGLQYLGVVADAGREEDVPAADKLLEDLAARIREYPPDLVKAVRLDQTAERRFIEDHAPLYMDLADLETIRVRLEARRDWEAAKKTGALLDEDEPPPSLDFEELQSKYEDRRRGAGHFDGSRFSSKKLHSSLLLLEAGAFDTGRGRGAALLARVKGDLAALRPGSYAPGLRVGFAGDIAINVEETSALITDLSVSSVIVVVLVVAAIVIFYGWWRSIAIVMPPLLLATVYAFAIASLPPFGVTELNSNTAFLGSIIVGNGINFGIVLLARYVEERRQGAEVRDALARAVWGSRTGTLSAALAAGVSYASLGLTHFRGFRQFGIIGGLGMALSWLVAYVLVPPLAAWIDRGPLPPKRHAPMAAFVRLTTALGPAIVVVVVVLAAAAGWEARSFGPQQIETDFAKLRRADTWANGAGYWGPKMDSLLGTYVTPTVVLADSVDQARAIGRTLKAEAKEPPLDEMVASVRTLDDVVPSDQEAKIDLANRIAQDLTPKIRASLTEDQRRTVDRFLGRGSLHVLLPAELPTAFTTGLRERDGVIGREVLVFPRPGRALWEGPKLSAFVARLRAAASIEAPPGKGPARVAGSHLLSSDILESVRRDGPKTSAVAFGGVVIVVLLLLRTSQSTLLVTASLLLGVLWLVGAMMALRVKINFANFIAYPITFGIGVDYAVNVASRWELDGRRSIADAVRTTGGAVTLCSLTTIIGYSSLLIAENRALFLFGLLAVLGEAACLSAAIVAMPAFVQGLARLRARAKGPEAGPPGPS
jgi:predicted exporter